MDRNSIFSTVLPGRRSTRLLVLALILTVFAGTVGAALFYGSSAPILSRTGVDLLESIEERATAARTPSLAASQTPALVWIAAHFVDVEEPSAVPVVRVLDALSLGMLVALTYLFATFLMGPIAALFAPLLLLLQPQFLQRLMEVGAGFSVAALLVPALLLGVALTRARWWARLALCGLAGLVGGVSVFAHHLGIWTTVGATLALFIAVRPSLKAGQLKLAPLGLELVALLICFGVAAVVMFKLTGMEGKEFIGYLFGPFKAFHPPLAVAGTVYREVVDGGPPLWTTAYLWVVRTPLSLWVLAGLGLAACWRRRARLPDLLWLTAGPLAAILIVTAGAGSPLYSGSLNLLAPLALLPALLGAAALAGAKSPVTGPGWTRYVPAMIAATVVAHLAVVDARHLPHPSAYANVLGGGSGGSLAGGNGLYVEATLDESAALELLSLGKRVVVSPWDGAAAPVLARYARELGRPVPKVRSGGVFPALLHVANGDPAGGSLLHYCKGPGVAASLTIDHQVVWCVVDSGAAE